MFQYEFEKRPASARSCESQATVSTDWSRRYSDRPHRMISRPLPPRPVHDRIPTKPTVPLKVWIVASASCFAVCAALVLATVVITKWGTSEYTASKVYSNSPEQIYSDFYPKTIPKTEEPISESSESDSIEDNELPILEKLSFFKNIVNRNKHIDLKSKPQIHPIHDEIEHKERKIEKKDKPKPPLNDDFNDFKTDDSEITATRNEDKVVEVENPIPVFAHDISRKPKLEPTPKNKGNIASFDINTVEKEIKHIGDVLVPEFKPLNSEVLIKKVTLPESYLETLRAEVDYDEYYNDINLYDDYMQSNTMTSYLIEKVQELHNWITKDPDFEVVQNATKHYNRNSFGEVLKALNESLIEGNASIVVNKLKDIYFGENFTIGVNKRKSILGNETDLLSFGILSLDLMLLHNIQTMAWETQETARINMMKDPDVFAFNALFMDPGKVEAKMKEVNQPHEFHPKRQNKMDSVDEYDFGKNLLENVLEIGMSTARAAIHLGRVYKNTKAALNQISNKEATNQLPRDIDGNSHALNHLQQSYSRNGSVASPDGFYTELDCVWLLYCRNLEVTAKLNPPYGTMARINGVALRMLAGELSADKALDTMLYEVLAGWTELRCNDMFPKVKRTIKVHNVLD